MAEPVRDTSSSRLDRLVPIHEWDCYLPILKDADRRNLRYALGGGLAFSHYSGRLRNTKDLDLFVLEEDRDLFIGIMEAHGFGDLFEQEPYDRKWIYRGVRDGLIIDIIWMMANGRSMVDPGWTSRGPHMTLHGYPIRLLPPEELVYSKLHVLQKERCDWPDLFNILHCQSDAIDWDRLIKRVGPDLPLLSGVMSVFAWLRPELAEEIPEGVWKRLGLEIRGRPAVDSAVNREDLLDSRDWFGPGEEAAL
jgi:hypothetical protein